MNVSAFHIDVVRDFLRALSGKPGNNDYGTTITGRDSVHFSYEFEDFSQFGTYATICMKDTIVTNTELTLNGMTIFK